MSVISMLNDPNTESPANLDASLQFRDDREAYNKKVRMLATKSLEDMWVILPQWRAMDHRQMNDRGYDYVFHIACK